MSHLKENVLLPGDKIYIKKLLVAQLVDKFAVLS